MLSMSFLPVLLDPNIVFLLFIVAMIGLYVEISHPGLIVPGVLGSLALVLFLLSAGSLSVNWSGLVFMVLGFSLLMLETQVPTHGALTLGAVISLIGGTLLFFKSGASPSHAHIDPIIVFTLSGLVGLLGLASMTLALRARRRAMKTGPEGMIGAKVVALTPLLPEGRVSYAGEDWAAILDAPATSADPGSTMQIVSIEGLRLHVRHVRPYTIG